MASEQPLLTVDLRVDFPNKPRALSRVCFEVRRGEILGLVGESGSGKSTIALAILKLLGCKGGKTSGRLLFRGRDLLAASEREMRRLRGREIALVLQSPLSSLNPALRIGTQLAESWSAHARGNKSRPAPPQLSAYCAAWDYRMTTIFSAAFQRKSASDRRNVC